MFNQSPSKVAVLKKTGRFTLAAVLLILPLAGKALAGPCRSNYWQPTFVHDLRPGYDPGPFYVMPGGNFVRLQEGNYVGNACSLIGQYGVRNRQGYTNCQNYTRIQCGCDEASRRNATCNRFLTAHQPLNQTNNNSLFRSLVGRWSFGRSMNRNKPVNQHLCNLTLTDRFVAGRGYKINACHSNESYWNIEGNQLVFRTSDGRVSTRFYRNAYGGWEGTYLLDLNVGIKHYLRK